MIAVLRWALIMAALVPLTLQARAEDRSVLAKCKGMVERASKDAKATSETELVRCRQVIREWALRDARTTVDEEGKPLR